MINSLRAGQLAPIIKGTVYNDPTASANPSEFIPLKGITVEILKKGIPVGEIVTDKDGGYSFMVDSIADTNYSIIIKRPRINDYLAQQTWASADDESVNPTTAYCGTKKRTSSGICRDNKPIKSDVLMTTDDVIAIADFAITTEELPPLPIKLSPQRIMLHILF